MTSYRAKLAIEYDIEVTTIDGQELMMLQDSIANAIGKAGRVVLSVDGYGQDVKIIKATMFTEVEGDPVVVKPNSKSATFDELEDLMENEDHRPTFNYQNLHQYHHDRATHEYVDYKGNRYSEEEVRHYGQQFVASRSDPPF